MNYNKSVPFQHYLDGLRALVPSVNTLRSYLYSLAIKVISSEYLLTLRKHKVLLFSFVFLSFLFSCLIGYSLVPRYIATGVMTIKPVSFQAVDPSIVRPGLDLLNNEILARRVITELKIEDSLQNQHVFKPFIADFLSPLIGYREHIKEYLGLKRQGSVSQPYFLSLEDSFFDRLRLNHVPGTQIVEISYHSDNTEDSILIVNAYMEQYKKIYSETKSILLIRQRQSLRQRLLQIRVKLHEAEIEFVDYIKNRYINNIGIKNNVVDKDLRELGYDYAKVEQMRIYSESNAVMSSVEPLPGSGGHQEDDIESVMEQLEKQLLTYEGQSTIARELYSEVELNRDLYRNLLYGMKEVSAVGGSEKSVVSIIDVATTSTVSHTPNLWLYGIMGIFPGLIFGVIFIFIRYFLNKKIATAAELEALDLSYPVLCTLHSVRRSHKKGLPLLAVNNLQSNMADSINELKATLANQPQGMPQLMLITSALPGEAKSSLVTNLASMLAKSNKRVLIIDANLRNPVIHKKLGIDNQCGLGNYLDGKDYTNLPLYKVPGNARLFAIPAGSSVENPVALLASQGMQLLSAKVREGFDHIIIDAPSVLSVSDSLVLSNLVDSILITVSAGGATVNELKSTLSYLEKSHAEISGFVFTKAKYV